MKSSVPAPASFSEEESPSLAESRFRVGDVLGERYQLLDCIGAGAMGAVFRAHDRLLDAELALKLMRIGPTADPKNATRRLLVEARAIARISHPGIVRIFDFGRVGDTPFIAMELLQGESLLDLMLREGPLAAERAVRVLLPVADAISVAHQRGVVHRDIKPENVLLSRDDFGRITPKLVDFGVARLREGGGGFTRPGALMGTPDYMAPEQAQGDPDVDQRADVWAFAVVLYEMISLRRPFAEGTRSSYLAILKSIVADPPKPLSELGVDDQGLWPILEQALAKPREKRFQSLREFGEVLTRWLLSRGVKSDAYGAALSTNWLNAGTEGARAAGRALNQFEPEESLTLKRPDAVPVTDPASGNDTAPPQAVAKPSLRANAPTSDRAAPAAQPPAPVSRKPHSLTLASARSTQWSPLMIAIVAAVIAAVSTAVLLALIAPRLGWQPPSGASAVVDTRAGAAR